MIYSRRAVDCYATKWKRPFNYDIDHIIHKYQPCKFNIREKSTIQKNHCMGSTNSERLIIVWYQFLSMYPNLQHRNIHLVDEWRLDSWQSIALSSPCSTHTVTALLWLMKNIWTNTSKTVHMKYTGNAFLPEAICGIGVFSLFVSVCACVSVTHELVRAITHQPYKLESPIWNRDVEDLD